MRHARVFGIAGLAALVVGAVAFAQSTVAPLPDAPEVETADLDTHPDVNAFFSGLEGLPEDQVREQARSYLEANPQVAAELRGIRQPLNDVRARCNVTLPIQQDALG